MFDQYLGDTKFRRDFVVEYREDIINKSKLIYENL